jgi:paraquat-inducible protein B
VALDYFRDVPKAKIDWKKLPPEFPVAVGGMAEMQEKIRSIVAKLDRVPLEEIGGEVRKAVGSLDNALQSATRALDRVEGETLPEAKKALEELRRAADSAERLLSNADNTLIGPDAQTQRELRDALKEFARAARSIRVLADYLERNPEALIRGKQKENP